jgi:flagellar biosynthetic protein FlhB
VKATENGPRSHDGCSPKADVVITNPTHYAIALKYDSAAMAAPEVVAKGAGLIAQRIMTIAREHAVMVVENKPLARSLYQAVEIGEGIPAEFYQAVAEILAYVYGQQGLI